MATKGFFGALKNEMRRRRPFATRDEAREACVGYVEGCYNRRRLHSSIGWQCPAEKMEAFFARLDRAKASLAA